MVRRRLALLTIVSAFFAIAGLPPASAQEAEVESRADYEFGSSLRFEARIRSESPLLRAALYRRSAGEPSYFFAEVTEADGVSIAIATLDLKQEPLPPFSMLTYWWELDFADGSTLQTDPTDVRYLDNRFSWRSISRAPITVFWIEGEAAFGEAALALATDALGQLQRQLHVLEPDALEIYIYPSTEELRAGLLLGNHPWTGGHAIVDLGVMLLAAPAGPEGQIELERGIPHEMTHLLLARRMGGSYQDLPSWLSEGLATLQEGVPDPSLRLALEEAAADNRLLPLTSLCGPFPVGGSEALLAYAQSASLAGYIRDVYGAGGISNLLDTYQEGATCQGGLQRVLQRSIAEVEAEWQRATFGPSQQWRALAPLTPWALLLIPIFLILAAALSPFRSRAR